MYIKQRVASGVNCYTKKKKIDDTVDDRSSNGANGYLTSLIAY